MSRPDGELVVDAREPPAGVVLFELVLVEIERFHLVRPGWNRPMAANSNALRALVQ